MIEFSYDYVSDILYFGYSSLQKNSLDSELYEFITVDDNLNKLPYFSYRFTDNKDLNLNLINLEYFAPTILIFDKSLLNQDFFNKIFIKSSHFNFTLKYFYETFNDTYFYYSNFIISLKFDYSETKFALCFNYLFNLKLLTENIDFVNNLYSKLNLTFSVDSPPNLEILRNLSLNGNGSIFLDNEIVKVKNINHSFRIISSLNVLIADNKYEVIYLLEYKNRYSFFYEKLLEEFQDV